jgi:hypothetical protein
MSIPNNKDVEEAQTWGRSLILNGLLIVILVSFTSLDLTEMLIILSVAIAMIWGGICMCRFSGDAFSHISDAKKKINHD